MKKITRLLFSIMFALTSCESGSSNATKLSFSGVIDIDKINSLDGKEVSISGYMATLSPINGEFMYLMNLPFQSCPFCKPYSSTLSNTIAVYSKSNKKFEYTDQAITVTGIMEVGDFVDSYGYDYTYRIIDATYKTIDLKSNENAKLATWYSLASDGVVSDINSMFNYLYFLCYWPDYYCSDSSGNKAYYLYPQDVYNYLTSTSSYGYANYYDENYFPSLIKRVKAIDANSLKDLISLIQKAESLADYALSELGNGNYSSEEASDIGGGELKYTLDNYTEIDKYYNEVYDEYLVWINSFEI